MQVHKLLALDIWAESKSAGKEVTRIMKTKKSWTEPELTVYGNVEAITQVIKHFGPGDGFVLNPPNPPSPIRDLS
jgi:hypothetical protein